MPKHDFFAPKAIANRMKAKGLQKLRWFCQVCTKQCRDENGYQSHIKSESHQRKILIVADNPNKFVDSYSSEFLDGFLSLLSKRYGTRRVFANHVYQEYISDKNHCHMNATKWATLSEFVMYLGKRGFVKVEDNEKGWFIEWIDNSPGELARKEAILKQERMKKDQEERDRLFIEEQVQKARENVSSTTLGSEMRVLEQFDEDKRGKISIAFAPTKKKPAPNTISSDSTYPLPKKVKVEEDISGKDSISSWLIEGIVLKILNEDLQKGKYYGKKGVVKKVVDGSVAELEVLGCSDVIRLDQSQLETVIPKQGLVLILKNPWRGKYAKVVDVNIDRFTGILELSESGEKLELEYEWFSKAS